MHLNIAEFMLSVLLSLHSSVLSFSTWNNIQTYENFGVNSFYYAEKEAFRQTTQCFVSIKSFLVSLIFFPNLKRGISEA